MQFRETSFSFFRYTFHILNLVSGNSTHATNRATAATLALVGARFRSGRRCAPKPIGAEGKPQAAAAVKPASGNSFPMSSSPISRAAKPENSPTSRDSKLTRRQLPPIPPARSAEVHRACNASKKFAEKGVRFLFINPTAKTDKPGEHGFKGRYVATKTALSPRRSGAASIAEVFVIGSAHSGAVPRRVDVQYGLGFYASLRASPLLTTALNDLLRPRSAPVVQATTAPDANSRPMRPKPLPRDADVSRRIEHIMQNGVCMVSPQGRRRAVRTSTPTAM